MDRLVMLHHRAPLWLLVPVLLIIGCGRDDKWVQGRPPVYPTSGQVLLDGEPVEKATVVFQPVDANGKPGTALTDARGYFQAETFESGDGLTAGTHRVSIRKVHMADRDGNIVEAVVDDGGGLKEKHFLPEKYANVETAGIEVTIEATGQNELQPFNLAK
jgi:hypothetical protein